MRGNGWNDYGVGYPTISYFESRLDAHSKVASFTRSEDILFHLTLNNEKTFDVLLVNDYTISEAMVYKYHQDFPSAAFIVTGGAWNAYTQQAKNAGRELDIGVFNVSEFFGALHWDNPKEYYQKDAEGNPIYAIRA